MRRNLVNRLLAVRAEIEAQIAALRARLGGRDPNPEPLSNAPAPAPFQPAAGMRPPAPPAERLDVRGKAA